MSGRQKLPFFTGIIATGFYSGYLPWASGTFGSIVGVLLFLLIPGTDRTAILFSLIILGFFTGVVTSASVARIVGHQLTASAELAKETFQGGGHEQPDPSIVVIDEIVGMWISLLFLPQSWSAIALAFVCFRAFDILKPPPARQLERIPGGWGIMLDDVAAGIYANLSVRLVLFLLPGLA